MKSKACHLTFDFFQVQILYTCNKHQNNSCEKKYLVTLKSKHPLNLVIITNITITQLVTWVHFNEKLCINMSVTYNKS